MFKSLPTRPNLNHLKKQAKELLRSFQANDTFAVKRFQQWHPQASKVMGNLKDVCLGDAQLVIAREYQFMSWPKLKEFIEASEDTHDREAPVALTAALENLRAGKLCILFDDESRENEGDFVLAAEKVSPEMINFITKHGRGTLCLSMTEGQATQLGLKMINPERKNLAEPAFMASIDATAGVTTGVSAFDRAQTIRAAIAENATPQDVKSPGHIFPLKAHPGGIRSRRGHTEGSIELVRMAGLKPAAVICEILKEDGTMARWTDIVRIGQELNMPVVQMSDIAEPESRLG